MADLASTLVSWLLPSKDQTWANKTVFNDRMRTLQANILDLNNALARCPAFMKNTPQLEAWRSFRNNWSKYYKETGTLVYFEPTDTQISQGKLYTSLLNKWLAIAATYKDCKQVAITPINPPSPYTPDSKLPGAPTDPKAEEEAGFWDTKTILAVAGGLAVAIALRQFLK